MAKTSVAVKTEETVTTQASEPVAPETVTPETAVETQAPETGEPEAKREISAQFQKRAMPAFLMNNARRTMEAKRSTLARREQTRQNAILLVNNVSRMRRVAAQLGAWLAATDKASVKVVNARAALALLLKTLDAVDHAATPEATAEVMQALREKLAVLMLHMPSVPVQNGTRPSNEESTALSELRMWAREGLKLPLATLSAEDAAFCETQHSETVNKARKRLANTDANVGARLTGTIVDADTAPALPAPETAVEPVSEPVAE